MKKILIVPLLFIGLSIPTLTLGSPIYPGFDLLQTTPGTGFSIPIPPPGSGNIIVQLQGNPSLLKADVSSFPSLRPSFLRSTDTIVERKQGINPFEPPTGEGTIDIELIALSLKSKDSFDGTPLGLSGMVDLYVTVNKASALPVSLPDLPQPCTLLDSPGSMTVKHTTAEGGTFTSSLTVDACLIFVTADGNVNNPSDIQVFMPFSDLFDSEHRTLKSPPPGKDDPPWSHTPPPDWQFLPLPLDFPFPAGEFYPGDTDNRTFKEPKPKLPPGVSHNVRLQATDVTLNVSKNGKRVKLKLTTSSELNAAEFLILRGEKLDNGGTAMDMVCSFASKGVSSSYTCTDEVVGDTYRVLEKEYDGRVILYDEVTTP